MTTVAQCTCGGPVQGWHEPGCDTLQVPLGRPSQAQVEAERDAADQRARATARDLYGVDDPWDRGAA